MKKEFPVINVLINLSEEDKERFAQRQLQIELADKRGHAHMGMNAKQTKGLDV